MLSDRAHRLLDVVSDAARRFRRAGRVIACYLSRIQLRLRVLPVAVANRHLVTFGKILYVWNALVSLEEAQSSGLDRHSG